MIMLATKPLRIVLVSVCSVLLVLAGIALSSCGPNHEQAIRDSLTQELESIKNLEESYLSQLTSDSDVSELSQFGIDPNEFFKQLLDGFDYQIQSVTVDGETADATVVISMKSMSDFAANLEQSMQDLLADESLTSLSEDEIYAKVGESIMNDVTELPVTQFDPVTITYQLTDDTWTPTEDSMKNLETAMLGN